VVAGPFFVGAQVSNSKRIPDGSPVAVPAVREALRSHIALEQSSDKIKLRCLITAFEICNG
jgi:hypothetical protein